MSERAVGPTAPPYALGRLHRAIVGSIIRSTAIAAPVVLGGLLLLAAGAHHLQLQSAGYTRSPLIYVEVALQLGTFLALGIQPVVGLVLLLNREWTWAWRCLLCTVFGLALGVGALWLDMETLLYAT